MLIWILSAIAIVLLAIGAAIVLYLCGIVLMIVVSEFRDRRNRKQHPPTETSIGMMTCDGRNTWHTVRVFENQELHVMLPDINGEPDPQLIDYLVQHWGELGTMAAAAKEAISEIQERHVFDVVCKPMQGDICLGFS